MPSLNSNFAVKKMENQKQDIAKAQHEMWREFRSQLIAASVMLCVVLPYLTVVASAPANSGGRDLVPALADPFKWSSISPNIAFPALAILAGIVLTMSVGGREANVSSSGYARAVAAYKTRIQLLKSCGFIGHSIAIMLVIYGIENFGVVDFREAIGTVVFGVVIAFILALLTIIRTRTEELELPLIQEALHQKIRLRSKHVNSWNSRWPLGREPRAELPLMRPLLILGSIILAPFVIVFCVSYIPGVATSSLFDRISTSLTLNLIMFYIPVLIIWFVAPQWRRTDYPRTHYLALVRIALSILVGTSWYFALYGYIYKLGIYWRYPPYVLILSIPILFTILFTVSLTAPKAWDDRWLLSLAGTVPRLRESLAERREARIRAGWDRSIKLLQTDLGRRAAPYHRRATRLSRRSF